MTSPISVGLTSLTTPSDREIRMERVFNATRERVWQAMTDPALVAQWWGRGNRLVIERLEVEPGGHWRFVEHAPEGKHGFEGRFREVTPPERLVQTFEWDPMAGFVVINTMTFEALSDGRTRLVTVSLFHTVEERDGMFSSDMARGLNQSYEQLDRVLAGFGADLAPGTGRDPALSIKKVAFTYYPITDIVRARKFYEETLGLEPGLAGSHAGTHWVEYDLPRGGCLAITNAGGEQPSAGAGGTIALEVSDLDALMSYLKAQGVPFKSDVIKGPHCRMAVCLDPEGNSILLHQLDRAAVS